ncbi:MAG TPA: hypothetical protein DCY20_03350 [Firmicutes bacterium]|nr:hypothetical protein [Bacillota bacterium]
MSEVEEKKKVNPWVIMIAVGNLLLLLMLGIIFKDPLVEFATNLVPEKTEVLFYPFEGIHVNLADENTKHYLKTNLSLEYDNSENTEIIQSNEVLIKATIVEILRSKTLSEISTVEFTKQVELEIMNEVNLLLEEIIITEVYFTDFLYQ